ncbi:hypothetical protein VQY72_002144 [Salmonella enterica]|nr:hypothetical protein [Salmonella enterica]
MKWSDIYILVFQSSNDLSWRTAFSLHQRYALPIEKMAIFCEGTDFYREQKKYTGFLSKSTVSSKIIILAHGTEDYIDASPFGKMYPVELLSFLYDELGLLEAGLITFKSCNIGKGVFLEKCAQNCSLVFKDLKVGWWKGYTDICATHFISNSCSFSSGTEDYKIRASNSAENKLSDEIRLKFIKGNIAVNPLHCSSSRWQRLLSL